MEKFLNFTFFLCKSRPNRTENQCLLNLQVYYEIDGNNEQELYALRQKHPNNVYSMRKKNYKKIVEIE